MEAFRKAAEKFVGKDLDMTGFLKLMKDGKLLAKDILPLAAEEMSKMAKNGDALKYSLNSLNSITQRLKLSFAQWSDSIYQGGLSDALKDLYKTLDDIFWFMKQGDSVIGGFLKGFLKALNSSIIFVYNNALKLYYMLKYDLGMNLSGEWFGEKAYWLMLAATFNTIYKTLALMLSGGLIGKLANLTKGAGAVGGAGALASGAGRGVASGLIPKVFIAGIAAEALGGIARWLFNIHEDPTKDMSNIKKEAVKRISGTDNAPTGLKVLDWFFGGVGSDFADTAAIRRLGKIDQIAAGGGGPRSALYQYPPQEPQKVIVEVNGGEFNKLIDVKVAESNSRQISSILPASIIRPKE